jgi:serine protease Do
MQKAGEDVVMAITQLVRTAMAAVAVVALAQSPAPAQQPAQSGPGFDRPVSFAALAERLSPAVVNISTTQRMGEAPPEDAPEIPEGAPFGDLFRDFFDRNQRGPRSVNSLGSGFVIDPDGFIVTNNHVIEDADEITANFSDGSSLEATLVGRDPKTDLAVLKVEPPEPLTFVAFGDSKAMRVGDWVLAIGNPFGLGGSVSAGIVSAIERDINAGPYDNFIQTDAAINRGNSGGPLFNMDGEVIGVNTAIISPTGGSIGIGFSVPSAIVTNVVAQLREFGETRRGWLGVRIQSVTDEIAESLDLPEARGALVADVTAGGPAEQAGLQAGDVILSFNGVDIDQMRDLPRIVADTPVGTEAPVEIWRDEDRETVTVSLGRLEEGELMTAASAGGPEGAPATALGMTMAPLSAETRDDMGLEDDETGVLITAVAPDTQAADKALRPGDLIMEVGQQSVATPAEVVAQIEAAQEEDRGSILLLVKSGGADGELRFVALRLREEQTE